MQRWYLETLDGGPFMYRAAPENAAREEQQFIDFNVLHTDSGEAYSSRLKRNWTGFGYGICL
jgi:hypothetical protein